MVNLGLVLKGVIYWFFGLIYTAVSYYMIPTLLDAVTLSTDTYALNDTTQAIAWVGLVFTWVLALIVAPAFCIIKGLRE